MSAYDHTGDWPAEELQLLFHIGHRTSTFDPQPDITPYESARIAELFLYLAAAGAGRMPARGDYYAKFCLQHGLMRHFREV